MTAEWRGSRHPIGAARYVRLTTRTADSRPKHTPVWIVELEVGRVAFTTGSTSWKVRRILKDPAVELQASDADGVPLDGSGPVSGTAMVVDGAEFRAVRRAIRRKYRWEDVKISLQEVPARLRGRGPLSDCAVVVDLEA
ncbi:MAG: PPOX class F420-dependent oxidoreductase [Actinomycetota bacterium]|nr:PPOX class F420-dependent oxidoreductase [Actinomycetota bacterium]MED6327685.1 PPOX class F420-dependent oxidoreductase [Actinomycetota bacterium]MEE2958668.1 PPOX class F420-dependent oxidoreductase [Actinomycetota bacterium]